MRIAQRRTGETRGKLLHLQIHGGPRFCNSSRVRRTPEMPEQRDVYGCAGANRPEAQPYIDEVDGVLYYTCPECRKALQEELDPRPREGGIGHAGPATASSETSA